MLWNFLSFAFPLTLTSDYDVSNLASSCVKSAWRQTEYFSMHTALCNRPAALCSRSITTNPSILSKRDQRWADKLWAVLSDTVTQIYRTQPQLGHNTLSNLQCFKTHWSSVPLQTMCAYGLNLTAQLASSWFNSKFNHAAGKVPVWDPCVYCACVC